MVLDRFIGHRTRAERSLTERRRPLGPSLTGGVDRNHLEHWSVLVDGHESLASFPSDCDLEPRNAAQGAVLEVGDDPLDERVPGGKKVEGLFLECLLAVERADVARPTGYAWQTVDQRPVPQLDREDPAAARALDGEP